jgi:hypothetical protein
MFPKKGQPMTITDVDKHVCAELLSDRHHAVVHGLAAPALHAGSKLTIEIGGVPHAATVSQWHLDRVERFIRNYCFSSRDFVNGRLTESTKFRVLDFAGNNRIALL